MSYICLEGGSEFGGEMRAVDRRAMDLAGGTDAKVCIVPTAAAVDNNQERAGENGKRWFESLGAQHVEIVPIIDEASANEPTVASTLDSARLIFMLGGSSDYLGNALRNSMAWRAMRMAYNEGAVLAGSSAGAMVLCSHYYNPHSREIEAGLGLVPSTICIPHFNRADPNWVAPIRIALPDVTILGIDEYTGLIDDGDPGTATAADFAQLNDVVDWEEEPMASGEEGTWTVYGGGSVTVLRPGQRTLDEAEIYAPGALVQLHG